MNLKKLKTYFCTEHARMPKRICIIGGGPAGVVAGIYASKHHQVFIFEKDEVLKTILPTGGGRCNLAYEEYDIKELAKYYPRGEKFLYSVFSRFSTKDTLEFFETIGMKTYTQTDSRIFPVTDSSKDVKAALLKELRRSQVQIKNEKIISVSAQNGLFEVQSCASEYEFDAVIIASGGRGTGHKLAQSLGHSITPLKPALTSLKIEEKFLFELSGLSLPDTCADIFFQGKKQKSLSGDLLFTHVGISGPLAYKISSHFAYTDFNKNCPLKIVLKLTKGMGPKDFDSEFSQKLTEDAKKDILNTLCSYIPRSLAAAILKHHGIDPHTKSGQLKKQDRLLISSSLTGLTLNAISKNAGEEIVTAGGVNLKEINPKTMESRLVKDLYFCGEILDIDGLTGGFNLQNCWSTGFIAGSSA